MFNSEELKGKWLEIKGEIVKKWGEVTDNDLETTKGNLTSLVGVLSQKLGLKKEEAQTHLSELADQWRQKGKSAASDVAGIANDKIDQAKEKLKN